LTRNFKTYFWSCAKLSICYEYFAPAKVEYINVRFLTTKILDFTG